MSNPETNQPLLPAPTQQAGINGEGIRPSRAYKVAGLTLLACVLIVGQVMTAYFLLSQQSDLKSLKEQNENLNSKLTVGRSAAAPARMHIPMNSYPKLMDLTFDEDTDKVPQKTVRRPVTKCQQEAAGVKPVVVPGFRPDCDERGLYRAQQCFLESCWCVDTATGQEIPGSLTKGMASCGAPVSTGSKARMMQMPDVSA
ncbi:hypothetical protein PBY51_015353 [Eleginops maclovinus]|uniref:Thyroglobulin type-1 domain-containing protein n=1 Tax=Eleginops maclovinus TaxID=56733 RepID=A0AAN7X0H6_ELEMC|nr:hypothetical protein PBY51_015353 [Eleginops maclovinus]